MVKYWPLRIHTRKHEEEVLKLLKQKFLMLIFIIIFEAFWEWYLIMWYHTNVVCVLCYIFIWSPLWFSILIVFLFQLKAEVGGVSSGLHLPLPTMNRGCNNFVYFELVVCLELPFGIVLWLLYCIVIEIISSFLSFIHKTSANNGGVA